MDDQQHELNEAFSGAIHAFQKKISQQEALINALIYILQLNTPSLKNQLTTMLEGQIAFFQSEGEDSTHIQAALNTVRELG